MTPTVALPTPDGGTEPYTLSGAGRSTPVGPPPRSRTAYSAVHVVAEPLSDTTPGAPATLDWDATLAFRRHIWSLGLGVAEAMDTAQRGMGMTWETAAELIRRTSAEARATGGLLAAGAGTDHAPAELADLDAVTRAYEEQLEVLDAADCRPILMASRQLAQAACGPEDYAKIYGRLLTQVHQPAILHWLGPMFDPALAGYWGSAKINEATETFLSIIRDHTDRVDGVKVSLLDADHEVRLRATLPEGVRLYTGDDFNYPTLIKTGSDALLGIFAAIAPAAAAALRALDAGDEATYDEVLAPTVPLSRHLFSTPTYYYKTGICFLAWLCGHQDAFAMVGGLHSGRPLLHLVEAFRLADRAGLFTDPDLAAERMRRFLAVHGVV